MKKKSKGILSRATDYIANFKSRNVQTGTDEAVKGMDLFLNEAKTRSGTDFSTAKGFLFEYIEAAKFNRNAANNGSETRAVVTGAIGKPHDPADIVLKNGSREVQEIQAKFTSPTYMSDTPDNSVGKAVSYQAGSQKGHWGKYHGMKRLVRREENYADGKSFLDVAMEDAKRRSEKGSHANDYADVARNLTDEIEYKGVKTGGTTETELMESYYSPERYANKFQKSQYGMEITNTAKNGAISSAVMSSIVSGVTNFCQVISDEKELGEAIKDIEKDALKSGVRGGAVGALGSSIRIAGVKNGIPVLNDATAAITIAGGVIDSGVAIYAYAKGEITGEELQHEIVDTTVKSTSTIFVMKGLGIALKSVSPIAPIVVYSVASQMVSATRTIIENAKLNAEEYNRAAELLKESVRLMQDYHRQMNQYLAECEEEQREAFSGLITGFTFDPVTGEGYEQTIATIVTFANKTGMELQHTDFDDYCRAMKSKDTFVLK